jgi:hypothetical protein
MEILDTRKHHELNLVGLTTKDLFGWFNIMKISNLKTNAGVGYRIYCEGNKW